jgi:hypothetical protein
MDRTAPGGRPKGEWFVRAAIVPVSAIAAVALAADEIHWTLTGPTSVTFDWRGGDSTIHYGPTPEYGYTVTGVPPDPMPASSPGPFWEARITGLDPGAVYHYSIEGETDHAFRTAPKPSQNFVVCVEGDIGAADHYPPVAAVQDAIAKDDPWFVLVVGDLTYADDFGPEAVDRHFDDAMAWSRDAAYMPAWGNHEWNSPDDMTNYKAGSICRTRRLRPTLHPRAAAARTGTGSTAATCASSHIPSPTPAPGPIGRRARRR